MKVKVFECKGCGALVFVKPKETRPPWCPICRGGMEEIQPSGQEKLVEYQCPECSYQFYFQEGSSPYKCPNCNFTFIVTPKKRGEERL